MNPMLKLLVTNKAKGSFKIEAQQDAEEATIYLYDMIVNSDTEAEYWGGVSPQAFVKALNDIKAPVIHLRVNSPGGSVFAARAIEQAIREHKSTIVAHVDGLAASAASFLIMAADKVHMAPGSFLMIHKAWTYAMGNSEELMKTAAMLDQIDASLVKTYVARSGQSADTIAAQMAAETWLDSDQAVAQGFADQLEAQSDASNRVNWDLSAFKAPPSQSAPSKTPDNIPQPDREALRRAALKALIPAA